MIKTTMKTEETEINTEFDNCHDVENLTYLQRNGSVFGPYSLGVLTQMHELKKLEKGDLIYNRKSNQWVGLTNYFKTPEKPKAKESKKTVAVQKKKMSICRNCGEFTFGYKTNQGSIWAELALWGFGFFFVPLLVVAVVYSIWRLISKKERCSCGSTDVVKILSPVGRELVKRFHGVGSGGKG